MADRIEIETRLLAQDKESIQTQVQRLRTQKNRLQDRMEQLSGMWEAGQGNLSESVFIRL